MFVFFIIKGILHKYAKILFRYIHVVVCQHCYKNPRLVMRDADSWYVHIVHL